MTGPRMVPSPPSSSHQDHLAGHREVHIRQRRDAEHQHLRSAAEARQRTGEHEADHLEDVGAIAERNRAAFVLADSAQAYP